MLHTCSHAEKNSQTQEINKSETIFKEPTNYEKARFLLFLSEGHGAEAEHSFWSLRGAEACGTEAGPLHPILLLLCPACKPDHGTSGS